MKRVPLEPVRVVRARKADVAADELRRAAEDAARSLDRAELARAAEQSARRHAADTSARERAPLVATATPRELAQLAAFEAGTSRVAERFTTQARRAEREAEAAAQEEDARRTSLGRARGELQVVEKHQALWRAHEDRRAQDGADEAAEEAHAARRPSR